MIEVVRSIYPVGQGCFCAERFYGESSLLMTFVYDCGSYTLSSTELEKLIDSEFHRGSVIDAIFISHFHYDHINGIPYLLNRFNVKQVVVPFVDQEGLLLLFIHNAVFGNGYGNLFPLIESLSRDEVTRNKIPIKRITIDSFETIDCDIDGNNVWQYLPIVSPPFRSAKMKNRVMNGLITNLCRHHIFKQVIISVSPLNIDYSLFSSILLNCNYLTDLIHIYQGYLLHDNKFNLALLSKPVNYNNNMAGGCLYTGDYEAQPKYRFDHLKQRLGGDWNTLAMLQIPHHGSKYSHNDALFKRSLDCFVCDSSSSKRPSFVINRINTLFGINCSLVSEQPHSLRKLHYNL